MRIFKGSKSTLHEFRTFVVRANAIDLAIGVAIGAAFTAVVNSIVTGMFTPIISALMGHTNFAQLHVTIRGSSFEYGALINAVISLLIVAAVLFFFVVKPLGALRSRLGIDVAIKSPCPACRSDISVGARRCPMCTEVLGDSWVPVPADDEQKS